MWSERCLEVDGRSSIDGLQDQYHCLKWDAAAFWMVADLSYNPKASSDKLGMRSKLSIAAPLNKQVPRSQMLYAYMLSILHMKQDIIVF